MPMASAAISSPRIVASTRPNVDVAILRTMTIVRIATAKIQKKFVIGMAAVNPVATPTARLFRMITRMISENPSVTMEVVATQPQRWDADRQTGHGCRRGTGQQTEQH